MITVSKFDKKETVVVSGDLNGHVGRKTSCELIVTDLVNAIIRGKNLASDWQVSSVVNSFKGKSEAIEHDNY